MPESAATPRLDNATFEDLLGQKSPELGEALKRIEALTESVIEWWRLHGARPSLVPSDIRTGEGVTLTAAGEDSDFRYIDPSIEGGDEEARLIYRMGFLFLQYLAGHQSFESRYGQMTGPDWGKWHFSPKPPRILGELRPDVPEALSEYLDMMLARDAAARPSLVDLHATLRHLSSQLTATRAVPSPSLEEEASPRSAELEPRQSSRRQKSRYVLTAVLLGVVAAGTWAMFNGGRFVPHWPGRLGFAEVPPAEASTVLPALPDRIEHPSGAMRLIGRGEFRVGEPPLGDRSRTHSAFLPDYYMDETEVTNAAYRRHLSATAAERQSSPQWDPGYFDRPDHPAIVSWTEAEAYCRAVGKRLPTDHEWEKAARGSAGFSFPWGEEENSSLANVEGTTDSHEFLASVSAMQTDKSPYGVLGLAGNAPEWVSGPAGEGQPGNFRPVRGGSYLWPIFKSRLYIRRTKDAGQRPGVFSGVGFRCAASVEGALVLASEGGRQ